jgi:TRAP-type C4-dicarboxylate transport system permease small subunit
MERNDQKNNQGLRKPSGNRALRMLTLVGDVIGHVGQSASVICLVIVLVSIFAQVFCRFLLGFSLIWSEEIGRYLLIWISFMGLGVLVKRKEMMSIRMVVDRLPTKLAIFANVLADACSVFFLFIVFFYGLRLVSHTMEQLTIVTEFPMGLVYLAIPLGAGFYVFHVIVDYLNRLKREG